VWDKALAYSQWAGEKAMARSAYREAVGSFEHALGALRQLPEQRGTREQAIDLRLALRSALRPLGDFRRILACLREAEALAVALDDPRRLGRVSVALVVHFAVIGAYDQAIAAAQRGSGANLTMTIWQRNWRRWENVTGGNWSIALRSSSCISCSGTISPSAGSAAVAGAVPFESNADDWPDCCRTVLSCVPRCPRSSTTATPMHAGRPSTKPACHLKPFRRPARGRPLRSSTTPSARGLVHGAWYLSTDIRLDSGV
jgi:hypothetical protein